MAFCCVYIFTGVGRRAGVYIRGILPVIPADCESARPKRQVLGKRSQEQDARGVRFTLEMMDFGLKMIGLCTKSDGLYRWANDKKMFGAPSRDYLTRPEFSKSMYELIDEWCGAVESIGVDFRLILH